MLKVRKAVVGDGEIISKIIEPYAKRAIMLKRPVSEVYNALRDFVVCEDENGKVLGVSAIHIYDNELSEVRSFAVDENHLKEGVGTKLLEANISEARELGLKKVFVLTYESDYFKKFGFKEVVKEELPQKVWRDCISCTKFPHCDETALVLYL